MQQPEVLVTGAGGFIGSHLVEALLRQGRSVRAMVRYNALGSQGWLDAIPAELRSRLHVVAGDVCDGHFVQEAMKGCEQVFHLAALISIPYSYVAPESYLNVNVRGTLNVLQAARTLGVAKVVHTSTSEVYGTAQFVPITEAHPLVGQSPYSASKIGADQMAVAFHRSFATPVAIIRPFNTYGPRQSVRAVIPTIITQAMTGQGPIRLGKTSTTRDFTFVEDTVAGFLAVAASPATIGQVVNVGSNFEVAIADVVSVVAEVLGRELAVDVAEERLRPADSEVDRLWADNRRARELTGWQPRYAGIEGFKRGIRVTADWLAAGSGKNTATAGKYQI